MKKKLSIIAYVLGKRNYFILFLVSGLLYGLIYAVMTNLIDVRFGLKYINYSFTNVSIAFVILFSILGGILISLQVFAIRNRQKSLKSANVGFIGALISFFNTTCPFCKPLLLSLIGFSGSIAILKFGFALAIISMLLLLVSIYLVTLSIDKSNCCEIETKNNLLPTKIVCACCSAGSTITSLGCMGIMTATIAATGAVAMGSMGAMASTTSNNFSLKLLNFIGLGFLTKIDLKTLESILIVLLLVGVISIFLSYKYHKKPLPLILSILSSILIYASVFIIMSNSIYFASLIGLITAVILNAGVKQDGNRK